MILKTVAKHNFAQDLKLQSCVVVLGKKMAIAYMDVGKGREQDAEALPAHCALSCNLISQRKTAFSHGF